jgi:archaellum component FlaF (FlaF/FlaG flagellin family)
VILVITTLVVFAALYVAWDEISFAKAEKKALKEVWTGFEHYNDL